jgi:hypothetical protein
MDTNPQPRISYAERVDGSIVISFDDRTSFLYSAALLYSFRLQARQLLEDDEAD